MPVTFPCIFYSTMRVRCCEGSDLIFEIIDKSVLLSGTVFAIARHLSSFLCQAQDRETFTSALKKADGSKFKAAKLLLP